MLPERLVLGRDLWPELAEFEPFDLLESESESAPPGVLVGRGLAEGVRIIEGRRDGERPRNGADYQSNFPTHSTLINSYV